MNSILRRRRALMGLGAGNNGKSDMNGWTDGVKFTDLTVFDNKYWNSNLVLTSYNGWSASGYIPCAGASKIYFPRLQQSGGSAVNYNGFVDANKQKISNIQLSRVAPTTVTVPANAAYFVISSDTTPLNNCINAGIIPYE